MTRSALRRSLGGLLSLGIALGVPEAASGQAASGRAASGRAAIATAAATASRQPYVPGPGDEWERRRPAEVGMDSAALAEAIRFAIDQESPGPRDLELAHAMGFGREPYGEGTGPFKERGDPTGIVLRAGYIVAEWGDPQRVDMTFSVTKSFLSSSVGLAFDRGLIRDPRDPVHRYMAPVTILQDPRLRRSGADRFGENEPLEPFASEHARTITWATCSGRPAIGKARCGGSPTGPTDRAASGRSGSAGSGTVRARCTSTTTCG